MLKIMGSTYLHCHNEVTLGVLKALLTTVYKLYASY